jgi:hypothetical protein
MFWPARSKTHKQIYLTNLTTNDNWQNERTLYLDGPVQRGTGELVIIFGVDHNLHNIMGVSFKHLWTGPFFIPVPEFYKHVI